MAIRTKEEIVRDIKTWLESRIRVIDTGSNTVLSNLMFEAITNSLAQYYTNLSDAQTAQGISDPANVSNTDLDDAAFNLNITRKPSSAATGFVTFRRSTAPTNTIRIGNADGSGGIIVGTSRDQDGIFVTFKTTETVFFTTDTPTRFDSITGLNFYEVSAAIQSLNPGTSGNKGAGTIQNLLSSTNGVEGITNYTSTTGGKDEETNVELASRLISKLLGFQPGILEGLRTIALNNVGVQDASVVGPDDLEFQRSPIGAVDVVLKGTAESTAVDTFKFINSSPHLLENRPASRINSVVSTVGLTQSALTPGAQWSFSQDEVTEERHSDSSNDHLSWAGTNLPNVNANVIVTYTYDTLVKTVQDEMDLDSSHYPASRVLVKQSQPVIIDIALTVKRNSSVGSTTLKNNISTALTNYIDSLGLGSKVSQSDLVRVVKTVSGIQRLTTPFSTLARQGSSGVADIQMTKYEHPDLNEQSLDITITT